MSIRELIRYLEEVAPPVYQESYDNAGLLVGDADAELRGVLLCLDSTEAVIDEAIASGCNLVVAHHPIIFRGLKQITGRNYVERVVLRAIRNDIAIYAIHTNLDNVYQRGVNEKIAEKIGLQQTRLLAPKTMQKKILTQVAADRLPGVKSRLSAIAELAVSREQLEIAFPAGRQHQVLQILREEAGNSRLHYQQLALENESPSVGSGMIGELAEPMSPEAFLRHLKTAMRAACIRHTAPIDRPVQRVAVCGGAGGFLLPHAIRQRADVFVTADYKYHEFFDADGRLMIADIGHYESEQYTVELLYELISQKFTNFAAHCTEVNTNPVHYFT